jgi:hypothetical protein
MALLVCDSVTKGLRPSERTVSVRDVQGRREFLRVELGFLTEEGGKYWLPVGKVYEDKERGLALVELPQEGESGANRLWVRVSDLLASAHRTPA